MRKLLRTILLLLLLTVSLWLLPNTAVRETVTAALSLCARSVIPALFPFMVVSAMLVSLGLGEALSGPLGSLMNLYRIGSTGASALVLGLIGGYPSGAAAAGQLYRDGLLNREETERLLSFCNNANPAFLVGVLGKGLFGSFRAGLWLWILHVAAALTTGLLLGRPNKKQPPRSSRGPLPTRKAVAFPSVFVSAVQTALRNILNVCAFIVVFSVLSLPFQNLIGLCRPLFTGILELFSSIPLIPVTSQGFVLAAGLSAWGGLSVLCQAAALTADTGLSLRRCAAGKALQGVLCALMAFLVQPLVFPL